MEKDVLTKWVLEDRLSLRQIAAKSGKSLGSVRYWCNLYELKTVFISREERKARQTEEFSCNTHGNSPWTLDNRGYRRCKACRYEALVRRRKNVKAELVAYKGGKCELCGYHKCMEVLEFHHKDPKEKDFGIGAAYNRAISKLKLEVDKCALLCANCHREVHAGVSTV